MNYEVSILMPGIRPQNWVKIGRDLSDWFHGTFEWVIVSPFMLPVEIRDWKHIKYIRDWGNPTRCFNIALHNAEGRYVTWIPDDAHIHFGYLNKIVNIAKLKNNSNFVVGISCTEATTTYTLDHCRLVNSPQLRSPHIGPEILFLPSMLIDRNEFVKLGGLNTIFEHHAMAHCDLAVRMQKNNLFNVYFEQECGFHSTHMPGTTGDHGPIHYAQIEHDEPLFAKIANEEIYPKQIYLDINDWKKLSPIWERRFPNGK